MIPGPEKETPKPEKENTPGGNEPEKSVQVTPDKPEPDQDSAWENQGAGILPDRDLRKNLGCG